MKALQHSCTPSLTPGLDKSRPFAPRPRRDIVQRVCAQKDPVNITIFVKRYSTMQLIFLLLVGMGMLACPLVAWPSPAAVIILGLPLLITLATTAYRLYAKPCEVVVDAQRDQLGLRYRRWTRKPAKILTLSQFPCVRSFERGGGGWSMDVVELVSSDDLPRTVLLGVFDMDRAETTRFL